MTNERVRIEIENDVAHVVLSRPDKHNGLDWPMITGILRAAEQVRKNRSLRAVILRGEGPSFCAGLDFGSVMKKPAQLAALYARLWSPRINDFQRVSLAWREVPAPVIAVIQGNCFGGGMQLALGADIRFCTPDARLSLMEAKWGLIPDMGGTVLLRDLLPMDRAMEITMTARILSGTEALELGLVTHVKDDPLEAAQKLAAEIATRSPDAVAATKALFHRAWPATDEDALAWERRSQRRLMGLLNQRISMKRNFEKRDIPFAKSRFRI
jgi:enoyl-CoA hydratase/carnithine racemase